MDFDHAADSAPPLSHPREDAAHGEDETTPDSDVRNIDSQPGDVSSMTDSKGDLNVAKVTEGYAKEDLLDLDPYGRKSPESEQAAPATGDSGLATNKLQNENPLGLPTHSAQDADILKPQERDHDEIGGSEDTPTHISSDTPAYASNPLSNDPISTTPEYFSVHGNAGDEAAIPILSDGSSAPMFESSGRKDSLSPDQPLESGTVETENDHVDPALDTYSNEPTPKSDASFELPIVSTAATTAELSAESSNPVISDSIFRPINSSVTPGDLRSVSPAEKDPPTPEQTQILPKSDSPVLLETATKPDTSAIKSNPNPDVPAAEAPAPYINPDPFQDYNPPVEKNELGDHRSARIPSPSSMDAEPPTPIERSALSSIKDSEELIDAERVVDNLPIEALRNRDVQAALASASVIPPAPDKPLPPTPGSESRAPVGCLGHQPVMEILLWRDPKKSGAAFATGLVLLFSMIYCSFISVVAYFALALLTVTLGFRLYKTVMAMVQKTNDGHPFQDLLSVDTTVTTEKGHELSDRAVAELNCCSSTLKDLFLVKDIFESVKFGFVLYLLTYLGAWFNTMTLVIIGYVAMFTLPKVYEQNKEKIDEVLGQVKEKVGEISAKVKAAIPMGKKAAVEPVTEEKKEE